MQIITILSINLKNGSRDDHENYDEKDEIWYCTACVQQIDINEIKNDTKKRISFRILRRGSSDDG